MSTCKANNWIDGCSVLQAYCFFKRISQLTVLLAHSLIMANSEHSKPSGISRYLNTDLDNVRDPHLKIYPKQQKDPVDVFRT